MMAPLPPVTPRSTAAHAYVASLDAPVLDEADRHHLEQVLRIRTGTIITVGDGCGGWRPVELGPELVPAGPISVVAPPSVGVTVAFALVKGDRSELITRALTEIGVDRIVPLHTARSVVRWDQERARSGVERLRRVARSAGMQSRRLWLPEVAAVIGLSQLAPAGLAPAGLAPAGLAAAGLALAVPGGPPVDLAHPSVLVGPEGGWADEELDLPYARVGLGPHVLRTETAAIVAGALLVAARNAARR